MKLNKQKWIKEVREVEAEIKQLKQKMHVPHYETSFNFDKLFELKAKATRLYVLRKVMKIEALIELSRSDDLSEAWTAKEALSNMPMDGQVLLRMTEIANTDLDLDCRRLADQAIANPLNKKPLFDLKSFYRFVESSKGTYLFCYWTNGKNLSSSQIISMILDGVPSWKNDFLKENEVVNFVPAPPEVEIADPDYGF
jgi:hypothetical protein